MGDSSGVLSPPLLFSAGFTDIVPNYERLVDERLAVQVELDEGDDPIIPTPGNRKRRIISESSYDSANEDTRKSVAYVISSGSEETRRNLSRSKGSRRAGRPRKTRKTKGSPRLELGPGPTSEDYSRLAIWTNEEIRKNTICWLDEIDEIRKKVVICKGLYRVRCVLESSFPGRLSMPWQTGRKIRAALCTTRQRMRSWKGR